MKSLKAVTTKNRVGRKGHHRTQDLPVFLMTDQPTTCPQCGRRTFWTEEKSGQLHRCDGCAFVFILVSR